MVLVATMLAALLTFAGPASANVEQVVGGGGGQHHHHHHHHH
jgi:hypothetical protein